MRETDKALLDIEKRILEVLKSIDKSNVSKETQSLINAIECLTDYFGHRSKFEQEFSANVSHELRTPLAGIRLQTELAMSSQDYTLQEKAHKNILTAVAHSERLIEQLLILSRLSIDPVDLIKSKVNIGQLSARVVGELVDVAEGKGVILAMNPWRDCFLQADEGSLSILLHNLIRNAIHYSPQGEKVTTQVKNRKNNISLSIIDNGPGIPPDQYDLVLERFKKVSCDTKSGSGLGLSIAKRICDLHDATLTFSRTSKTSGFEVTVTFLK
ncbi:MAG: sensor histidine kinase [Cellvibrionaceae bacterium]